MTTVFNSVSHSLQYIRTITNKCAPSYSLINAKILSHSSIPIGYRSPANYCIKLTDLPPFLLPIRLRDNHLTNPTLLHLFLKIPDLFSTFPPIPFCLTKRLSPPRL